MREDFIMDENGDFPLEDNIQSGIYFDTPYGESSSQHIEDIIFLHKGWLEQYPTLGFGISKYQNAEFSKNLIEKSLSQELSSDGYAINGSIVFPTPSGFYLDTKVISESK